MSLAKAFSRFSRAYSALHLRSVRALGAASEPTDPTEDDEAEARQRRLESVLQSTLLSTPAGGSSMTLSQAWALHEALQARFYQARNEARELDPVEQAAFERLVDALEIAPVFEHTVHYAASFTSSTLTWQGNFADFKAGLELGLAPALDGWEQSPPQVSALRFDALQFECSSPDSPGGLGTLIVSGEVRFVARVIDDAPQLDALKLAHPLSVTIAHRTQPVPKQYLPLRSLRVLEQART